MQPKQDQLRRKWTKTTSAVWTSSHLVTGLKPSRCRRQPHSFSKNSCNKWKLDIGNVLLNKQKTAFPLKSNQLCSTINISAHTDSEIPVCDPFCFFFFKFPFVWKHLQTNIQRETVETNHYAGQFYINHFNINKKPWTTKPNWYTLNTKRGELNRVTQFKIDLFSCRLH